MEQLLARTGVMSRIVKLRRPLLMVLRPKSGKFELSKRQCLDVQTSELLGDVYVRGIEENGTGKHSLVQGVSLLD